MPYHPRFLAGLFSIFPENLNFLNFLNDIGVLSEVKNRWKTFFFKKKNPLRCGFDHNEWGLYDQLLK